MLKQKQVEELPVGSTGIEREPAASGVPTLKRVENFPAALARVTPPETEPAPARKKKSKGKVSKKAKQPGSARGIETMFRTAYRSQLDLTALAATKANIMISLNGLILSVLTLSAPFVLVSEPLFALPIAVFLTTCLISIIFAVLAAQPRFPHARPSAEDFRKDRANLLVFEDFSALSESQHLQEMAAMMRNNGRIYKNMTRQLYRLGTTADRKFRMLSISYTAFLVGLTVSTLLLLAVGMLYHTQDVANLLGALQTRVVG